MPRGPGDTPTEVGGGDDEVSGPFEPESGVDTMDAESLGPEPTPSRRGPAPKAPEEGDVLAGRYRLSKCIGSGGMGDVFAAEHIDLAKPVAVKVLAPALATKRGIRRFLREAQSASKLRHPNVIQITDFGKTDSGLPFFVMELLEGEDLGQLLARSGPLKPDRACRLAGQILAGLARAHQQGIVHRDLKPGNCFILDAGTADERVKLLDFGIAKLLTEEAPGSLTKTGAIIGTPHYMSPEQALGKTIDHRTDVYALGVVLYELISGRLPFDAPTPMAILSHHITEPVTPLAQLDTDVEIEPWLDAAVLKALAKSPDERYATAEAFAEVLRTRTDVAPVALVPPKEGARRRWGLPVTLGVAATLLGGFWIVGPGRSAGPSEPPDSPSQVEPRVVQAKPVQPEAVVVAPAEQDEPDEPPPPDDPVEPDDPPPPDDPPAADPVPPPQPEGLRERARKPRRRPRELPDAEIRRLATAAVSGCNRQGGMSEVTVRVRLSLDANGTVSDVHVALPYGTGPVGRCVDTALRAKKFRAARQGKTFEGRLRIKSTP